MDSKEFLEKIKSSEFSVDSEGGLVVLPQKEFTLKIMQMNQEPLIVNVTSHPIIASPEQTEIVKEEEAEQAIRIPMSLGPVKEY